MAALARADAAFTYFKKEMIEINLAKLHIL